MQEGQPIPMVTRTDIQAFWDLEVKTGKFAYVSRYARKKNWYTEKMRCKRKEMRSRDDSGKKRKEQLKVKKAFNKNFFSLSWFCDVDDTERAARWNEVCWIGNNATTNLSEANWLVDVQEVEQKRTQKEEWY